MKINERNLIVGAAAAGTIIAGTQYGAFAAIPAIGGISQGIVLVVAGVLLATVIGKDGPIGAAIEGAGYGLICAGALTFGS